MTSHPHVPPSGIFTPNMVPLDARGETDHGELARSIDWLIGKGADLRETQKLSNRFPNDGPLFPSDSYQFS